MKRITKSAKAVVVANKVLDILDIVITPIHIKAMSESNISKNEMSEVYTLCKLIKDIAQLTEDSDESLEHLTDEEIQAQLEEYRKQQGNDGEADEEEAEE